MCIAGVILAGGKNRRMGQAKAMLKIDGQPIIERVAGILKGITGNIMIISNDLELYHPLGYPVVSDIYPGRGPLGGIYTGLIHSGARYILVAACDMPFLDEAIALALLGRREGYDLVVPRIGGYPEPLFAVYGQTCLEPIEENLKGGRLKITDFFAGLKVCYVEEEELAALPRARESFFNVNTPEDLAVAIKIEGVLKSS
jgi:molybdopterin-guanine dinucleotide biosynthesis protein A